MAVPPKRSLFDIPDAGFGYRASKVQKQVLGEVWGARLTALGNRASNLPPNGQRRRAFDKGHKGQVLQLATWRRATVTSTLLRSGVPSRRAVHVRRGVILPHPLHRPHLQVQSLYGQAGKRVDVRGNNIKKLTGAPSGGTTANHNLTVGTISLWFRWSGIPHMDGACGLPRT